MPDAPRITRLGHVPFANPKGNAHLNGDDASRRKDSLSSASTLEAKNVVPPEGQD
jgi:hypothetical protein